MIKKEEIESMKKRLEYYQSLKIEDAKVEELMDLRDIQIDSNLPVIERILSFIVQIGNPY